MEERVVQEQFHHPFTPYEIQLQFMRALYGCLEDGKVAVFESPTGKSSLPSCVLPSDNPRRYCMCFCFPNPDASGTLITI